MSDPQISKSQYAMWKNSPVTQVVFNYLKAYQQAQRLAHLDRWESGESTTDPDFESSARGVCLFVTEFTDLQYEEIAKTFEWDIEQNEVRDE
jgi:hypothetical protein